MNECCHKTLLADASYCEGCPVDRFTPEELDAAKKRAAEYADWYLGKAPTAGVKEDGNG